MLVCADWLVHSRSTHHSLTSAACLKIWFGQDGGHWVDSPSENFPLIRCEPSPCEQDFNSTKLKKSDPKTHHRWENSNGIQCEALGDWGNRSPVSDLRYRQTLGAICSSSRSRTPCRCACRWAPPNQKQTKRIRCREEGAHGFEGWLGGARGMTSPTPICKIPARPPRFQMTSMITITKKQPQNQIAACVMGVIRCSKMGKNNRKG